MSAPVDVLAVLREYAQDTGSFRVTKQGATNLAAACAVVAELIEADKECDAAEAALASIVLTESPKTPEEWMMDSRWRDLRDAMRAAKARRIRALDRVQGGVA